MTAVYRVADFIADFLAEKNKKQVFLLPGGGAMHLVDAVGKHPDIEVVACQHEQAAGIAAEAWARISESAGVAMVTTGPGATNVITPVAGAWIESVPMLVVSGQVKRADRLNGKPLRQNGVQEVDIVSLVRTVTKYAITLSEPLQIRYELEKALAIAESGRAGPVWIDVPLDVQGAPVDPQTLKGWAEAGSDVSHSGDVTGDISRQLGSLLKQARRPLILAGHGVRLSGAASRFRQWVENTGIPVVMTWNAMDLLADEHPLNVGRPGVVALRAANFAVQNCDLLISIGSRLDNIITAYDPGNFAPHARKVVVDVDAHEIEKLDMPIELSIDADAAVFLQAVNQEPYQAGTWDDWILQCQDWKRRYALMADRQWPAEGEISSYHLTDRLSEYIPENTLISTGSSGLAVEAFYTVFRNRPGQRVFLTSGLGAMGYGLPAAVGACFANRKRPMVAVESDGSLQLNLQELATLKGFELPVCLIIMNNQGYASIRNTQRNYFDSRFVGTGPEAGLFLPDLEKVAATYELEFVRIDDASTLDNKLRQAIEFVNQECKPVIVDVHLCTNETLEPKVAALPQADGSMLSMPLEDMSPLLPLETLEREMLNGVSDVSRKARQAE